MDNDSTPGDSAAAASSSGAASILGLMVLILIALYLVWWLPARVASGYLVPQIQGSVATLPTRLPVIWIRPWPWRSVPPAATVTYTLVSGRSVSVPATATAEPAFYARSVRVILHLSAASKVPPTQITAIRVSWADGSSTATESALWVTAQTGEPVLQGAKVVWSQQMRAGARPGVTLPAAANPDIVSISSPQPHPSPWTSAACIPMQSPDLGSVASHLLAGRLVSSTKPCNALPTSGQAIVLPPPLRQSDGFLLWQPEIRELVNTHLRNFIVDAEHIASQMPVTPGNWWRFVAAPPPPGF